MDYLSDPIDVALFDRRFRVARGSVLKDATLVAFSQTGSRWVATYQDDEVSMQFEGSMSQTRKWLAAFKGAKEETP